MKLRFFQIASIAATSLMPGLVSCDKATSMRAKWSDVTSQAGSTKKPADESASEQAKAKPAYLRDQVSNISPATYAGFVSKSDALVVVDFYADWCGPCKALAPVLSRAAEAHPGVVFVGKMNLDQAGSFPSSLGVQGIPDVRIFKAGKEVDRFVGFPGEGEVMGRIARHAKGIQPAAGATNAPAPTAQADPAVKPFSKGWLPPGMSRVGSAKTVSRPEAHESAR